MQPKAFIDLTKSQARNIILNAAGLAHHGQFGTGIEAVYKVIDHLGFVQLDTNYVVERAHHHVMAARIPDYRTEWLAELVEDGRIFEYFTSDAGFIPMNDFHYSLPVKAAFKAQIKTPDRQQLRVMQQIMDRVEREGQLMLGDIENDRVEASNGWWDWRPAKVALERLYLQGDLVVSRNKSFHKVYDLPPAMDQTIPTPDEYAHYVIRRTLGALGISSVKEINWRARRVKNNLVKPVLQSMVETGEVQVVVVDDIKGPLYMLPDQQIKPLAGEVFILSPFDILNVFRHRLKQFFDFDYQIECFVPADKRQYGYFSLPILAGDKFIARMDAKADRKKQILIVHNIHFEAVDIDQTTLAKLADAIKAFVLFNNCNDVVFTRSNSQLFLDQLLAAM
ncbi:winged helix-turn-helix domain-containing protein [Mucilaginibacter myungsuensis]|uniref:YcaQ family DNA glycosylase n=1 Tax=Mucilaginibacter myungsuensis TaxID=649104 RepID=A0A929KUP7_9SPHI|nr:crosslink repair DNA glycosylase YcaQ family protein [Mucilaginibacter myungsuensis]MBE9660763.1 YcaQ family DNA glycosylase [Mucilaginibacter myungsuensis]MDN3600808.1 crosslink repair DNA glycosylase YcaQ family protein [Mucilaginibacter myungsuensis]